MAAAVRPRRYAFVLDCPDAGALADFYARLLGRRIRRYPDYPGWVDVLPPEGEEQAVTIACQQIPDYRAPQWPEGEVPQQAHLDLYVDRLEPAAARAEAAGARRHERQPSDDGSFLVFLDPAGHPFCLCVETPPADAQERETPRLPAEAPHEP